jgi:histidinol phosphatase-like enzyme
MLLQAAQKYNIDLSQSYMVGDDMRDVNAGINAGCIPVFLTSSEQPEYMEGSKKINFFGSLKEFADTLE